MGTGYDCMDMLSHLSAKPGALATTDRRLLRDVMERFGFAPYENEWWHYTLRNESFPGTYSDFPIKSRSSR